MCKEVDGLCLMLHYCTPWLVRTSAESTPYKGATSPIPLEPLLLLLLLLLLYAQNLFLETVEMTFVYCTVLFLFVLFVCYVIFQTSFMSDCCVTEFVEL